MGQAAVKPRPQRVIDYDHDEPFVVDANFINFVARGEFLFDLYRFEKKAIWARQLDVPLIANPLHKLVDRANRGVPNGEQRTPPAEHWAYIARAVLMLNGSETNQYAYFIAHFNPGDIIPDEPRNATRESLRAIFATDKKAAALTIQSPKDVWVNRPISDETWFVLQNGDLVENPEHSVEWQQMEHSLSLIEMNERLWPQNCRGAYNALNNNCHRYATHLYELDDQPAGVVNWTNQRSSWMGLFMISVRNLLPMKFTIIVMMILVLFIEILKFSVNVFIGHRS